MNEVAWAPKARKQFGKLDQTTRRIIFPRTEELMHFPETNGTKKLKYEHKYGYRLRVDNYRVFFDYYPEQQLIKIREVVKRKEDTYD